ncbi:DUF6879 family protein [Streptomyces sp. CBMA152]|uniref:DUF6879 family protein n=1 Tax=Streptomyces sp. CBMA152 TaxID=1896312 RepID=UPI001661028D|nr:DUF6879 family protein [Streptomyces sp. CBMA152]MBD0746428.1 hypothetical protein [Streptomyces sp. CBMA152]
MHLTPFSEAAHLFEDFEHTAWRLETRRGYASDRHSPNWQRWLRGEDVGQDAQRPWLRNIAAQTSAGKRIERVRLVDDPPTEGQRFLLARAPANVAAGEDIRNLYRADAERLGLPDFDFWLFDSRILMRFAFDDHDTTLGVHLSEEPFDVVAACRARDAAWHYAVRAAEFARTVRSAV